MIVELVGIIDRRQIGGINDEQIATQRIRAVSVDDAAQPNQHACAMRTG